MKKSLLTLCVIALSAFTLQSCKSSQSMTNAATNLEGEWNIIEINSSSIVPAEHQPFPYIGFNTETNQFYGSSGCNRMSGMYTLGKSGKLTFGKAAATMMMCPDMSIEKTVFDMLEQVKSYKVIGSQIALYGKMSKPIAVLDRKDMISEAVLLTSKWKVIKINGESMKPNAEGIYAKPYIELNYQKKTITGNAGCNRITGQIEVDPDINRSMSFPHVASTRMACPNMAIENEVLKALNSVSTYKLSPSTTELSLLDKEGKEVLRFVKMIEE